MPSWHCAFQQFINLQPGNSLLMVCCMFSENMWEEDHHATNNVILIFISTEISKMGLKIQIKQSVKTCMSHFCKAHIVVILFLQIVMKIFLELHKSDTSVCRVPPPIKKNKPWLDKSQKLFLAAWWRNLLLYYIWAGSHRKPSTQSCKSK